MRHMALAASKIRMLLDAITWPRMMPERLKMEEKSYIRLALAILIE